MVNNLDWLGGMSALELLRDVGKHFRVGKMLAKEAVSARLSSEHGISYTEFSYQILQAADFLELHRRHGVRLQTGGSDQWGNLTAGVDLVHRVERPVRARHGHAAGDQGRRDEVRQVRGRGRLARPGDDEPVRLPPVLAQQPTTGTSCRYVRYFSSMSVDEEEQLALDLAERPHLRAAQRRIASELTALVHGDGVRRRRRGGGAGAVRRGGPARRGRADPRRRRGRAAVAPSSPSGPPSSTRSPPRGCRRAARPPVGRSARGRCRSTTSRSTSDDAVLTSGGLRPRPGGGAAAGPQDPRRRHPGRLSGAGL